MVKENATFSDTTRQQFNVSASPRPQHCFFQLTLKAGISKQLVWVFTAAKYQNNYAEQDNAVKRYSIFPPTWMANLKNILFCFLTASLGESVQD